MEYQSIDAVFAFVVRMAMATTARRRPQPTRQRRESMNVDVSAVGAMDVSVKTERSGVLART
jgi:hypothetical protein